MQTSYSSALSAFSLGDLAARLDGDLAHGINACVECCDRHAHGDQVALHWHDHQARRATYTFAQLQGASAQFAHWLTAQGVQPGDRVAGLLPRVPELLITILGTWRAGAVYQPLFTAFGPEAIEYRLASSEAKIVVTDATNQNKLAHLKIAPRTLVVGGERGDAFQQALNAHTAAFTPVMRSSEDAFIMLFTSGTTGKAKGVPVPIKALMAFEQYMRLAVDLRAEDKFWNIADPGWAYGLYYSVTGPLLLGHATTFYDGPFAPEAALAFIKDEGITNLAGAPTAFRLLMTATTQSVEAIKGQLRAVSSAGEPLNPEVIKWFAERLGAPIFDHYGQTEIGMVVCNHHGLQHQVKPGTAGYAMPGYSMTVVEESGDAVRILGPNQPGILAVDRAASPLYFFPGYWRQETPAFRGGYYLTGDTVEMAEDGCVTFVGRSDDIITSSGYRIGPFEVESCLIEHPAVMEAAVVGRPDAQRTEIVKAFVVLRAGFKPDADTVDALQIHVKTRLAAHAYPREIAFVDALPKTPSGKIQRFLLRQQT